MTEAQRADHLERLRRAGLDVAPFGRRLKQDPATSDIRVVALTAYAMKGDEARALAAGCDGYLAKSVDTRTLATTVARLLAQREQQ